MTFSLKIQTPITTVSFGISTSPAFVGYRLLSYQPGDANVGGPAIDTIVFDVCGTSVNDAFDKLRFLRRALVWADADNAGQNASGPAYIEWRPLNGSYAGWSVVFGGAVNIPPADSLLAKGIISNVTIALRREPFWRGYKPQYVSDITTITSAATGTASIGARGKLSISGIPGDIPALVHLRAGPASSGALVWGAKFAYVSQRANPLNYNSFGLFPGSTNLGVAGVSVADATSDNGNGNAAQSTAGFGTVVATTITQMGGAFRVYARMRTLSPGTSWSVKSNASGLAGTSTEPIVEAGVWATVTDTNYQVFDLGVIQLQNWLPSFNAINLGTTYTAIYGTRTAGTGQLNVDWVYYMPVHEYYLDADQSVGPSSALVYDNMTPAFRNNSGGFILSASRPAQRAGKAKPRGELRLPPGNGTLYWLFPFGVPQSAAGGFTYGLQFRYCPLYQTSLGSGA